MPEDYRRQAAESSAKRLHCVANASGCPGVTHLRASRRERVGAAGVPVSASVPGIAFIPDRMATIR